MKLIKEECQFLSSDSLSYFIRSLFYFPTPKVALGLVCGELAYQKEEQNVSTYVKQRIYVTLGRLV